jgi:hypothetical protein
MAHASYPTAFDRFWMEPGTHLPCRIDPYSLLAVADYGACKQEAVYQCICMRCGTLHRIGRAKLQVMTRNQKRRAKRRGTVWPPFSGHCGCCSETDEPKLTGAKFSLQKLNANGFSVVHWARHNLGHYQARIGIYDPQGQLTEARPFRGKPWDIFLEVTGPSSALASSEEMFCRLLAKLFQEQVTTVYSRDGEAISLKAFCLPSGILLR